MSFGADPFVRERQWVGDEGQLEEETTQADRVTGVLVTERRETRV